MVSACVLILTGENFPSVAAPVMVRVAVLIINGEKGCEAEGAPVMVSVWVLMTMPTEGATLEPVVFGFAVGVTESPVFPRGAGAVDLGTHCAPHSKENSIMIAAARMIVPDFMSPSHSP